MTFWCENCQQDLDGHPTSAEVDEANAIVGRIQVAFNGVVLGNGMTIHEADLEGVFESELSRRIAREKDVERNWSDVPDWKCSALFSALYAFDAEGWKFYLPAYMCWALRNWRRTNSPTMEWLIGSLTQRNGFANHFSTLTFDQSNAVLSFLQFCRFYVDKVAAANAISVYWSRFEAQVS